MDTTKSSVPAPRPTPAGDLEHVGSIVARTPAGAEGRPHACYEGAVYIGHLVEDPESGDEAEVVEVVPCRRCSAASPRS